MTELTAEQKNRQHAMKIMAKSEFADIQTHWQSLDVNMDYDIIKPAQIGMVMVRAQAGEGGVVYNQGEMTATRCVVQSRSQDGDSKEMGVGYTQGRNKQKAELMAVIDLAVQTPAHSDNVQQKLIAPLEQKLQAQAQKQEKATQATKVDFFTMVRGE